MIEELDEEVLDLLGQLDLVEESEPMDLKPSEVILTPSDVRNIDDDDVKDEIIQPSTGTDLTKYLLKLDRVTDSVLAACDADRKEAQDVIDLYRKSIEDAIEEDENPSRMWVDGLVKAVEVKANINTTAIKAMEATAKMLAATKPSLQLNQQFNGSSSLTDVLDEPLTDEDDY